MRPVILVVEDEPALREILSDMLERFDYVLKPFDMDRIGQVLEAALDSQSR